MGNVIFSLFLTVSSFTIFVANYRVNGINRVLYHIPISIFESSIPLVQESDEPIVYYDKEILEDKLTSYFDKELQKYTKAYFVSYYYYNQDDHSLCINEYCTAVEINLNAKVLFEMRYQKKVSFYIQKN